MTKSSLALSNLRGFAIVMVVAFHSCIAYLSSQPDAALPFDVPPYGWRANPIVDSARWLGFDLFCAFTYLYLMQLMFFLSGLFVWPSLSQKGARKFLYDRVLRLGVPFVMGLYLLMPVAFYPVYRVTAVDPSWSAFWSHWMALPFWPSGPMWFLWLLLAFNVAAAALYWLAPRAGESLGRLAAKAGSRPGRFFIALASVSALAYLPLAAVFEPWQWVQFGPFAFQPSLAPQGALARGHRRGIPAVARPHGADRTGNSRAGSAACRRPRPRAVRGKRVSRAGGGVLALYRTASAGIRESRGQRLRHLSRPLRLRALAAIHVAPRAVVRDRKGGDRIHRRAHVELGDERRHLPRSDRRAADGPQPARIGESALSREQARVGIGSSVRDAGACDARERREGLRTNSY